jgi:hypothetical protein
MRALLHGCTIAPIQVSGPHRMMVIPDSREGRDQAQGQVAASSPIQAAAVPA